MSYLCLVYVLSMFCLCLVDVLSMFFLCLVYVLSMPFLFLVYVLSMYCLYPSNIVLAGPAAGQDVVKNSSIRTGRTPHKALRGWGRKQGEETTISGFNNIKRKNAVGDV